MAAPSRGVLVLTLGQAVDTRTAGPAVPGPVEEDTREGGAPTAVALEVHHPCDTGFDSKGWGA